MTDDQPQLYSTAEVARRLHISDAHVRRLAGRHGIGVIIGKQRVFTDADVDRLQARNTTPGRRRTTPPGAPESPLTRGTGESGS